jgi:hypothetical protein
MANVTISIPDDVLREARRLAVDEGVSLSELVVRLLVSRLKAVRAYRAARERQLRLMSKSINLGTGGNVTWTRESLHER